jgi:hypothetical protein
MSPKGASEAGRDVADVEKGRIDKQAREIVRKASAAMKTGLFFTTLG